MIKLITTSIFTLLLSISASAQYYSVKTNALGLLTTNLNVAVDIEITKNRTFSTSISYNPFSFRNFQTKHLTIQPGMRFWSYTNYIGHFYSVNLIGSKFNLIANEKYRNGWLCGAGASYGYSWLLSDRFSLECEVGASIVYTDYDKGDCYVGIFEKETIEHHRSILLLPTKMAVSISYLF